MSARIEHPGPPGRATPQAVAPGFREALGRLRRRETRAVPREARRRGAGGAEEAGTTAGAGPAWTPPERAARVSREAEAGRSSGVACPWPPEGPQAEVAPARAAPGLLAAEAGALVVELGPGAAGGRLELHGREVRCLLRAAGAPGRERLRRGAAGLAAGLARLGLELAELEVRP